MHESIIFLIFSSFYHLYFILNIRELLLFIYYLCILSWIGIGGIDMDDKIYLTNEGLNEFKNEIEFLKEKLSLIQTEKSKAYSDAVGDGGMIILLMKMLKGMKIG